MADEGFTAEQWQAHARSVCFYLLSLVLITLVLSILAMKERAEARLIDARAQSFEAFMDAESYQELATRLERKQLAATPSPSADAARYERDQHAMAQDMNDAHMIVKRYQEEAADEAKDADRATASQIVMLFALLLAPLALPTHRIAYCRAALALAIVAVGISAVNYVM